MGTRAICGDVGVMIEGSRDESIVDLDRQPVINLFKSSGAILFRGFGMDLEGFSAFSSSLTTEFMTYKGGSYIRRTVGDGKDETLLSTSHEYGREKQDTFALPLHGEMYYLDNRPAVLWFYCVTPAGSDGETTICDGSRIYQALRASSQELFRTKRLKYIRRYLDGEWQKIYGTGEVGEVERFCNANGLKVEFDGTTKVVRTEYVHPAVIMSAWGNHTVYINNLLPVLWQESTRRETSIVRFEDGSKVPGDVVDELVEIQQRLMIPVAWQSQDLVMLDNTRFLHGRRPFTDTKREICLRMARGVNF
jgi:alpha-ketoglutarate-dependent taurine dioxygenase